MLVSSRRYGSQSAVAVAYQNVFSRRRFVHRTAAKRKSAATVHPTSVIPSTAIALETGNPRL